MTADRRWLIAALAFVGLVVAHAAEATNPEVWLTPIEPFSLHDRAPSATSDFQDMFRPGASWDRAASHVKVLENATKFVQFSSDPMLSTVLQYLKSHHIEYGLETGLVPRSTTCGQGVEGFTEPGFAAALAKKIQRLGGTLSYLAMDEPLFFAHHYNGQSACHYPIEQIARLAAIEAAALKQVFPRIQIGDIEPVGGAEPKDWIEQIMRWVAAYKVATGESLRFMHADVDWNGPWQEQLRLLRTRLHANGISFGIIFIGQPGDETPEGATLHAEERMVDVAADPSVAPDRAIIESWMRQPEHDLPETQPGTMTYLVDRYLVAPTRLTAQRTGNRIIGRLGDAAGQPVSAATIQIVLVGAGRTPVAATRTLSGTVPPGASSAILALRINTECGCPGGTVDINVGTLRYVDHSTGQVVLRSFGAVPQPGAAPRGADRFVASNGQPVARNTPLFTVTPGARYSIEVPMRETYASEDSAFVSIIFLGPTGREIRRDSIPIESTAHQVGQAVTDASGHFSFPFEPDLIAPVLGALAGSPEFDIRFLGSDRYRLSWIFLRG